jgi:hypothetical protein
MIEELILIAFCFLVVVTGLATVAFEVISGRILSIDGMWLSLISLTLAAVFGGNLAWSFYTGEGQQTLSRFRKGSAPDAAPDRNRSTPT